MIAFFKFGLFFLVFTPFVLAGLGSSPVYHARHSRAHKLRTPGSASNANATEHVKRAPAWRFPFGSTKVRGVNLGGWLLLEVCRFSSELVHQLDKFRL